MTNATTTKKKREILLPTVDIIFRKLFGTVENIDILKGFLKGVLKLSENEYESIEILDPFLLPDKLDEKYGIVDIRLKLKSGKHCHIEMQVAKQASLAKRVIWYNAKIIAAQLRSSEEYHQLKNTISIVISPEDFIAQSSDYYHQFFLCEPKTGIIFSKLMEINTLELGKLPEKDRSKKFEWARFFAAKTKEEFEMIAQANPDIKKAYAKLMVLTEDEKIQEIYEQQLIQRMDEEDRLWGAKEEGKAEGRIEGKAEGRIEEKFEVAKKMLKRNTAIDIIMEITGLTEQQILGDEKQ